MLKRPVLLSVLVVLLVACKGSVGAWSREEAKSADASSGLSWEGTWAASTAYSQGDVVEHLGSAYVAIAASTGEAPPGESWNLLAGAGQRSDGESVLGTSLSVGDLACPYGGSAFISVGGTTYACNGAPGAKGDAGTPGQDGGDGSDGSSGPWVDVTVFADLDAAIASPLTAGKTILIGAATTSNGGIVPLDRTLAFVDGGTLAVSSGNTLTVMGRLEAGRFQIFLGDGTTTFAPGSVQAVFPEWWGARGDYNVSSRSGTDDAAAFQAAADAARSAHATFVLSGKKYLIGSTIVFNDVMISGAGPFVTMIYVRKDITAFEIIANRKRIEGFYIWFDLTQAAGPQAIGIKLGRTGGSQAADRYTNSIMSNIGVRFAYRSFATDPSDGTASVVWNNTFSHCRSDLAVEYGWYLATAVGSTSLTFANCYGIGANVSTAAGWYVDKINNVYWIDCQFDKAYDGKAIVVNEAEDVGIFGLQLESCALRSDASRLIYVNAAVDIKNVVVRSGLVDVGAGHRGSVLTLGAVGGRGVVGEIILVGTTVQSGTLYKVDTNALEYGPGNRLLVEGTQIARSDVRADDSGTHTVFGNKRAIYGTGAPTTGTWEAGDIVWAAQPTVAGSSPAQYIVIGWICTAEGIPGAWSPMRTATGT